MIQKTVFVCMISLGTVATGYAFHEEAVIESFLYDSASGSPQNRLFFDANMFHISLAGKQIKGKKVVSDIQASFHARYERSLASRFGAILASNLKFIHFSNDGAQATLAKNYDAVALSGGIGLFGIPTEWLKVNAVVTFFQQFFYVGSPLENRVSFDLNWMPQLELSLQALVARLSLFEFQTGVEGFVQAGSKSLSFGYGFGVWAMAFFMTSKVFYLKAAYHLKNFEFQSSDERYEDLEVGLGMRLRF